MKKFHIALSVSDIAASVVDYSRRLNSSPTRVIAGEYALWRTEALNFSIRKAENPGMLRHLGWEDSSAESFTTDKDANGIVWECFSAAQQEKEIEEIWPQK